MIFRITKQRFLFLSLFLFLSAGLELPAQRAWRLTIDAPTFSVGLNQKNPNTIYVGGAGRTVYKSYNAGRTWDTLYIDFNGGSGWVGCIYVHPQDTNLLFAGGAQFSGIFRSKNGGKTWDKVVDHPTDPINIGGEAIISDPRNPENIYCASLKPCYIFRSQNRGTTWDTLAKVSIIAPQDTVEEIFTLAIRPDHSNIIFAGCEAGKIIKSVDSGRTWKQVVVNGNDNFGDVEVPRIVFSKRTPLVAYSPFTYFFEKVSKQAGGIYKTTDGGDTWNKTGYRDTSMWTLDVRTVGADDEVLVGGFSIYYVYPGAGTVGISSDGGATWKDESPNIPWNNQDKINKNAWMIKYGVENTGRAYMASERGFFVYDKILSVEESPKAGFIPIFSAQFIAENQFRLCLNDLKNEGEKLSVRLFDIRGSLVFEGMMTQISEQIFTVPALSDGVYSCQLLRKNEFLGSQTLVLAR